MDKIKFLKSYDEAIWHETRIRWKIAEARERQMSATAIQYSDMPKGSGSSDLSDYIIKIDDYCASLAAMMRNTDIIRDCLCHAMEPLDQRAYQVLHMRHIDRMPVAKIARVLAVSRPTVYAEYARALVDLEIQPIDELTVEQALQALKEPTR